MLPLLRVLPVGSLLLSALIFMLAAMPPRQPALPHALSPASGPLIDAAEHPEWRQFYLQAAFRRADALEHLRELPDTPTRMPPVVAEAEPPKPAVQTEIAPRAAPPTPSAESAPVPPQQVAGLPAEHETAESEDITGSLDNPAVAGTMPIEIGETSSTELPVVLPPVRPTIPRSAPAGKATSRTPQRKAARASKPKRQAAPAGKQQGQPAAQFNLFQSHFGATGQ